MLFRSFGLSPVIWFTQIRSPSPSGYCGAISSMRQSGVTYDRQQQERGDGHGDARGAAHACGSRPAVRMPVRRARARSPCSARLVPSLVLGRL